MRRVQIGERFRHQKGNLPDYEFAFHTLPEAELKICLNYESFRERAILSQQSILDEAKAIEREGLGPEEEFRQKLELQNEHEKLRRLSRPWLLLSQKDKTEFLRLDSKKPMISREPVRLASELTRLERFLWQEAEHRLGLEIFIDWSWSDKMLKSSFVRLVRRLRRTPGTQANLTPAKENRGRRSSAKESLFRLAIWRCRKAGLSTKATLNLLEPLRRHFKGPAHETLSKKLASIEYEIQKTLFQSPP